MNQDTILGRAPSNIALIKYMGKRDTAQNLPMNPSLSLTLDRFCTFAELTDLQAGAGEAVLVDWRPEIPLTVPPDFRGQCTVPDPTPGARAKIAKFATRLLGELPAVFQTHGLEFQPLRSATLRTANTFPEGTGLASSASAFAAVTLTFAAAQSANRATFQKAFETNFGLRADLARVSRLGSGSSCRSFLGPWCSWLDDRVEAVPSKMPELSDLVLLVKAAPKAVSSSEAHQRVRTSSAWTTRAQTATGRWDALKMALATGDLDTVARLAWEDSWDMHHLFHTSSPPFTYWDGTTFEALRWLMQAPVDGMRPIVTLDAGPNVHILVPTAQVEQWRARLREAFPDLRVLEDRQGQGAELLRV